MVGVIIGGIIGVVSTLIGTIVSWILIISGKIKFDVSDVVIEKPNHMTPSSSLEFTIVAFNKKRDKYGINSCKIIIEYEDGTRNEFGAIFTPEDSRNELYELANIEGRTIKTIKYKQDGIGIPSDIHFKIYLEYKLNGKRKKELLLIYKS